MHDADYIRVPLRDRGGKTVAEALVDAADYAATAKFRWHRDSKGYAARTVRRPDGGTRTILLHRDLLGLVPADGLHGDHINGDPLDNRRANLRATDHSGNLANRHGSARTAGRTSRFRGVSWHKATGRWCAKVTLGGTQHHLGLFDDEAEAADVASAFRAARMPTSAMDRDAA